MTRNLALIEERQKLSSLITSILEGNVIDETTGEVNLDSDDFANLEELNLALDSNQDALVLKTEAILFAIEAQKSKHETYRNTAKYYQSLAKRTEKTLDYLEGLVRLNIENIGEDNRLPTPSFPKLKLTKPGTSVFLNEEYSGELDEDILKQQTIKNVLKTAAKNKYGDNPPVDDDGIPLYRIVAGEPNITYR